jgi:uncharacterized membrane protein YheB (UPF0754 family)
MTDFLTTVAHNFSWQVISHRPDFIAFMLIAPIAAFVTWAHVWMALKMVFYPIKFLGFHLGPLPVGWQGIVPRKAGKISGIVVDQTISKLGSLGEIIGEMDPREMGDFMAKELSGRIEELIDEVMAERNALLWENLPVSIKRRVYAQVRKQMPEVMNALIKDISDHIESLVDVKEMIVRQMEGDRKLMVSMFLKVGQKEIDFIWNVSFFIGLFFGVVQMAVWLIVPWHWTLVFWAAFWGLLTNWIAIWMVFNPIEPIKVGPITLHGAFMRRQKEVSIVFTEITTHDMLSVRHIMHEALFGARSDRTRRIIKRHVSKMLEAPVVRTVVQLAVGWDAYAKLKATVVEKSIMATMEPLAHPDLNESRAKKVSAIFIERMLKLSPKEFQNLLRPAFQEDEWILIVLGGVTGAIAGWLQLIIGFK